MGMVNFAGAYFSNSSMHGYIRRIQSNTRPKNANVEIRPPNVEDFRTILKLALKALGVLRHLKTSQFERYLPGHLSAEPPETKSNSHRGFACLGGSG